ncbi:hypothetical protein SCHPADRAFT_927572 [Schizopora paradoxa]|uniref:Uncharacterized protein n=1 Tax=Schizopora paradoxa TaxID=27342 RepID=A0A0H2RSI3_9AGAM|nr:hypothetical protein SCHPADRAFT_927572 [Schizopora paradoxa]
MSGVTEDAPGLGPSSTTAPTPVYNDQAVVATQGDTLVSAPTALRGQEMRIADRRPQSILISRTPSPLYIAPPPLPTFQRDPRSDDPSIHASRSSSSSSISSATSSSSSSTSGSENTIDATDSPSSSLRTSSPPSPHQEKESPLQQSSPTLSASPSVTFAPLPNIQPRTRKSNRGPLGVAARGAILRERRQQMLAAQGRVQMDGLDGVEDNSTPGQTSGSCGTNAGKSRSRDPLSDESDDALIALGKLLNDAGRLLWKRVKGKSKSKGKNASFDIATIRAEDELAAQIEGSSSMDTGSVTNDEASLDSAPVSPVDALSDAELEALASSNVDPITTGAPLAIVVA